MTRHPIRVGVIGAGNFATECHIPGVQAHPQGEVVAMCARNYERTMQLARHFGVPDVYTDYHDLIRRPDIDAVTIAVPDALHFPITMAALDAGKHVFCEKPLAMNIAEARHMTETAKQAGKIGMVSFTFRYTRALQALRQILLEGVLGTPLTVSLQVHWGNIGYPGPSLGWYDQAQFSSSGSWGDGASHLFDALAYILAPVQAVCAQMMIPLREPGIAQPDTIDVVTCLARLHLPQKQDHQASLTTTYADREPDTVHITLSTNRLDRGPDEIQVVGTKGMAVISLTRGQNERFKIVHVHGEWEDGPLPTDAHTNEPLALKRMMGAFIESVARGEIRPDDPGFTDGLYTQKAIDAAIQSAREQRWVTV